MRAQGAVRSVGGVTPGPVDHQVGALRGALAGEQRAARRPSTARQCVAIAAPSRSRPRAQPQVGRRLDPDQHGGQVGVGPATPSRRPRAPAAAPAGPRRSRRTGRRASRSAGSCPAARGPAAASRPASWSVEAWQPVPARRTGRPCGSPGRPGRSGRDRGRERGLAGPGRAVDADQPARRRAWAGATGSAQPRTRRPAGRHRLRRRARGRGTSAPPRRTGRPSSSCTVLVCSNGSPDLACRNHTRSPIREQRGRVPGQRGLHLAGALEPGQVQPGRRPRDRQPVVAGGAGGDQPAAVHGRHLRATGGGRPGSPKNAAGRGSKDW